MNKKPFLRHPLFWSVFITVSLAAGLASYRYFSVAFPLIDLCIKMSKQEALDKAEAIAKKYNFRPLVSETTDHSQSLATSNNAAITDAATRASKEQSDSTKEIQSIKKAQATAYFDHNATVQNYIEIDRGGQDAWKAFLEDKTFAPFTWNVRHFREEDPYELLVTFTPDGKHYGFNAKIPETEPGPALTKEQAQKIALDFAKNEWHLDLAQGDDVSLEKTVSLEKKEVLKAENREVVKARNVIDAAAKVSVKDSTNVTVKDTTSKSDSKATGDIKVTAQTSKGYKLIDYSHDDKPNGRVDHSFIYEKEIPNLGDAHYRVQVGVTGDKVTIINHYIDIPEAFHRSYASMRSANDAIYSTALFLWRLLYLLGGCLLGILFLYRRNWLIIKPALITGFILALIHLLSDLNQLPLIWTHYNTALSTTTYLINHLLTIITSFIYMIGFYSVIFLAAEGLTRLAFGKHIQLWNAWKIPASSSLTMFGKAITGYAMAALMLGYSLLFYALGSRYCGIWQPTSTLTDLGVLSTYVPALTPLAYSISAGFWEECIFRAIPLSLFALLGARLGLRKWGIAIGLVVQALIFGAAHAFYPCMPSYARVVELLVPSFAFGALYILVGLVPAIIMHVVYDAILFSLPIFASCAPGIWLQKLLIYLFLAIPLLVLLFSRLKSKKWIEIPTQLLNSAWQPEKSNFFENTGIIALQTSDQYDQTNQAGQTDTVSAPRHFQFSFIQNIKTCDIFTIFILIGVGLTTWVMTQEMTLNVPALTITKQEAAKKASIALAARKNFTAETKELTSFVPLSRQEHLFVWQQDSDPAKRNYHKLVGTYLDVPSWSVRFAQFTGDLVQRTEEYQAFIETAATAPLIKHTLPETAEGKRLTEEEARQRVLQAIKEQYALDTRALKEVSANSETLKNRTDWRFTFSDEQAYPFEKGQARIYVALAGDEITSLSRYINIPEEWTRQQYKLHAIDNSVHAAQTMAWYLMMALLIVLFGLLIRAQQFDYKRAVYFFAFYCIGLILAKVLAIEPIMSYFATEKSIINQLSTVFLYSTMAIISSGILWSLFFGVNYSIYTNNKPKKDSKGSVVCTIAQSIAAGLFLSGILSFIMYRILPSQPLIPSFIGVDSALVWLDMVITYSKSFITELLISQFLLSVILIDFKRFMHTTPKASSKAWIGILALAIATVLYAPTTNADFSHKLMSMGIFAAALLLVYQLILKKNPRCLPLALSVISTMKLALVVANTPYPGAFVGGIITIIVINSLAYAFAFILPKNS